MTNFLEEKIKYAKTKAIAQIAVFSVLFVSSIVYIVII